jgi:sn-glycerol 3-phosphate transport system substrate-binding protein
MTSWLLAKCFFALAFGQTNLTDIEFWHSMGSTEETVTALAEGFNQSQAEYRVVPRYVGSYPEANNRVLAAISGGGPPVLFQAEISFFPRLVEEGAAIELSAHIADLPQGFIDDFYPGLWAYGELAGGRYGLPWNSSTPVLFYNATALRQRGAEVPTTWDEFEAVAARLTTRQTQGYIAVADSWTFEMMVLTRGGSVVTAEGRPNFTSPEATQALSMMQRLVRSGHAVPRNLAEATFAQLDFVRTKGMMVFASIANWPDAKRFAVAFDIAAAPVPTGGSPTVPLGGAQLVVLRGASEAQQRGAVAFWRYLMEPENLKTWIEASFYIPLRRSVLPMLEPWYAEDPHRRAASRQLEHAVPRPRVAAYATWQRYLEEAIERVIKGGAAPHEALAEAQRRAEAGVR